MNSAIGSLDRSDFLSFLLDNEECTDHMEAPGFIGIALKLQKSEVQSIKAKYQSELLRKLSGVMHLRRHYSLLFQAYVGDAGSGTFTVLDGNQTQTISARSAPGTNRYPTRSSF